MGFELDIYQRDELAGMYWYVSQPAIKGDFTKREYARYLQHIASTRVQHLERIRTFVTQNLSAISEPTSEQKTAFRNSLSFLDYSILEASATQSFADGLSCVSSKPIPLECLSKSRTAYSKNLDVFFPLACRSHTASLPGNALQHTGIPLHTENAPIFIDVSPRDTYLQ